MKAEAEAAASPPMVGELTAVERGPHHRIMEWLSQSTDESGNSLISTNRYTELASGLHYLDEQNQWQETVAEFQATSQGFVAARGPHQVALRSDIAVAGAVTLVTADGQTLRSTPTLLAFVDRATGDRVQLATLQPTQGEAVAANSILWPGAFGELADVLAVYTPGGFQCDIVLRKRLPNPADWGLHPETTDVAVYTEFFDTQPTRQETFFHNPTETSTLPDTNLDFGSMSMDRGRAFRLNVPSRPESGPQPEVLVRKTWEFIEGRTFLIEQTSYRDLIPWIQELPEAATPSPENRRRQELLKRTAQIDLPPVPSARPIWPTAPSGRLVVSTAAPETSPRQLAFSRSRAGVVLDYTLVNSITNMTFDGLTTYYVSGIANLSDSVSFQAGTVIKYAKTNSPVLNLLSSTTNFSWLGAPYQPVVLTSKDDNSVGEILPGATGTPGGYYASTALQFSSLGSVLLTNVCVRNAQCGIVATGNSKATIRHAQFVDTKVGVVTFDQTTLQNCLFSRVDLVVWTTGTSSSTAECLTADSVGYLNYQNSSGLLYLTNSLFVNVTNTSSGTSLNYSFSRSPAEIGFITAGAGAHYLDTATNLWFTDLNLTQISPSWIEERKQMKVSPPLVLTGLQTNNLTLSPRNLASYVEHSEILIGYSYWPVHYVFNNVSVANATLTFTEGVVVAFCGTNAHGIQLQSGAKVISRGRPEALNRFCRAGAVQELSTGVSTSSIRALLDVASAAVLPEIRLQFTRADFCADTSNRRYLLNLVNPATIVSLRDCQFNGALFSLAPTASYAAQASPLINNAWINCNVGIYRYSYANHVFTARHNLFVNGTFTLYDNDGASDVLEDSNGYNWQVYDTDRDGLSDGAELASAGNIGEVVSWGSLGSATDDLANLPPLTSYVAVAAGAGHNVGLRQDSTAFAWGNPASGATTVPSTATNLVAVSAGNAYSLGLKETGEIIAWGGNTYNQATPPSTSEFTAIAAGYQHALALKTNGTVVAWGDSAGGKTTVPGGLANVMAIAAGKDHSLALQTNGTVIAWGANTLGQTNVPTSATNVVEIAAGYTHSLALRADGTVIAWGDPANSATTVPTGLSNVLHVAAGDHFSVAMKNDYTLVGWGNNTSGQITFPASSVNLQSVVCGPSRTVGLPYTPVLSYPVDMRRDLLIIYNSNLAASTAMLNYYQSQRRFAGLAPKLGISLGSTLSETLDAGVYTNTFWPAVTAWHTNNPTKRPSYILLMYGVPNNPGPFYAPGDPAPKPPGPNYAVPSGGSLQNDLREHLGTTFLRRPYLSALNFNLTNDCTHYIDKLASVGAGNPMNCIVLSADKAGMGRDTYVLDNVKISLSGFDNNLVVTSGKSALTNAGVPPTAILYRSTYPGADSAVTSAANIYSYISWGKYNLNNYYNYYSNTWATAPSVTFTGNSSWFAVETIESVNGQWIPQQSQQSYVKWFSQYAFGGTNWDRTPIAATSTVYEPTPYGIPQPEIWLPLWATGHTASTSFWLSKPLKRVTPEVKEFYLQITGDPIVRR